MPDESQPKDATALKQVMAAAGGALFYLLTFILRDTISHRQPVLGQTSRPLLPPPLDLLSRVSGLMATFQFQIIALVIVTVLAVVRRHEPRAWIYALLAGMGVPFVVLHLLKLV